VGVVPTDGGQNKKNQAEQGRFLGGFSVGPFIQRRSRPALRFRCKQSLWNRRFLELARSILLSMVVKEFTDNWQVSIAYAFVQSAKPTLIFGGK